jgi:hypothetical protein
MSEGMGSASGAACRAAARLPRPERSGRTDSDLSPREFAAYIVGVDVLFTGFAIFMGVKISIEVSYGWLLLLAGLPAWLLVRLSFFSMRGSETGLVAVDRDGIVRALTGRRSIRRLARMYDDGPERWIRGGVLRGLGLFLGGMAVLIALTLLFDSPMPLMLFLTGSLWAMLDFVRFTYVLMIGARRHGRELLDGVELLPMLAAYGRAHGWSDVAAGVPADRLLAVFEERPGEARQLREYLAANRVLSGIAMSTSRWASGPS